MATIRKEVIIDTPVDQVWDAIRDIGALHRRLVPGFVTDTKLDGNDRIVTFGNGMVVRERMLGLDDTHRRLAWSAVSDRLVHHNASCQAIDEGQGRTRFVWIADILPDEAEPIISGMMEQGTAIAKRTLEAQAKRRAAE